MSRSTLTDDIRAELNALHAETGLSPARLLRGAPNRPPNIDSSIIRKWMRGEAKTADSELLDYVLRLWRSIRDSGQSDETARVSITPSIKAELERLQKQSGQGAMALLAGRKDVPHGLRSNIVTGWMNGTATTAKKTHLTYMMSLWSTAESHIPVTDDMRAGYRRLIEEARVPLTTLLKLLKCEGLSLTRRQLDYRLGDTIKAIPKSEHDTLLRVLKSLAKDR